MGIRSLFSGNLSERMIKRRIEEVASCDLHGAVK